MAYTCVFDLQAIKAYLHGATVVGFDFETAPLPQYREDKRAALDAHRASIVGISLSVAEGSAIYVPLRHLDGGNADPDKVIPFLRDALWMNPTVVKVAHNLAFESMFLYALGIVLQPPCYDTIAAAQMTLKSAFEFRGLSDSGLKTLVPELLGDELPSFEAVTEGRHFDELDPADAETVRYACADADYALRLYHLFNDWFGRWLPRHRFIVEQIESPTAVYCGLMKYNGVLVDAGCMESRAAECVERLAKLREAIAFIIGDVNIGANAGTVAFKRYLYQDLGLPVLKTTAKYQEAADEEAFTLLEAWCHTNRPELARIFALVLEYRSIGKVYSTYIQGYRKHIHGATGRIHPQLLPLGADSGRFSCRQPNIQNQKNGGDMNVRDFMIASPGNSLLELDYSQIEARLAAFLSGEPALLELYRRGEDLHAQTTGAVFGIPIEEASDRHRPDYKHRRTVAKTTFFGFLYGIYAKSLQRNLKLDAGIEAAIDDCKAFLDNLGEANPVLRRWQKDTVASAKTRGYAETALGRRRYLPNLRSTDFMKRGNAERSALNHGVQGLAADMLKLAMARLIVSMPPYVKPLFTVHDSLVFEVPDALVKEAAVLIKTAMEVAPPIPGFDITIIAEISVGKTYGSMEERP